MEETGSIPPALLPPVPVIDDEDVIEEKREKRHLKFWIIKVMVVCLAVIFISVVISMSYIFVVRGDVWHEGVLGHIVEVFLEIMEFMTSEH